MRRRTGLLALIALMTASGSIGWWLDRQGSMKEDEAIAAGAIPETIDASLVDLETLQGLAEEACNCQKAGGIETECWSSYRTATQGLISSQAASACYPLSSTVECIATDEGDKCISTGSYLVSAPDKILCTKEEAQSFVALSERYGYSDAGDLRAFQEVLDGARLEVGDGCAG